VDPTGSVFEYDSTGTLKSTSGTAAIGIAVDNKTNDVVATGEVSAVDIFGKGGVDSGNPGVGIAANNGSTCAAEPAGDIACDDLTQPFGSQVFNPVSTGTEPWAIDAGTFGSETDYFDFSREGTPTLWKSKVSAGKPTVVGSEPLASITAASALQAAHPGTGGWFTIVFDKGPASGISATLSTGDNVLDLVNASTMKAMGSPIKLPGIPFRMAKDVTNGKIIIAFADTTNAVTTYSSIDPTASDPASTLTVLKATDTLLSVGLAVSSDGTKIYSCQRNACHVLTNK
jgi:hypothetical protein